MQLNLYARAGIALLIGLFVSEFAQAQVFISGEIVEKGSDKHIPNAVVLTTGEKTGTKADVRGFFRLPMIAAQPTDTLMIMAAGYQPQRVAVERSEASAWVTVEVVRKPAALTASTVAGASTVATGPRVAVYGAKAVKKSDGMLQGYPGTQYALWLKGDGNSSGILKNVSFFVDALGFPSEPFRVHVYKALPGGKGPGEEMLKEKIVASAPKGGQWFTVDVSKYFIPLPPDGVFVAMEWLVGGESFVAGTANEDYTPYGQILAPTYEFRETLTWNYTIGKPWAPLTSFDKNRIMNAMIRAEVTVF